MTQVLFQSDKQVFWDYSGKVKVACKMLTTPLLVCCVLWKISNIRNVLIYVLYCWKNIIYLCSYKVEEKLQHHINLFVIEVLNYHSFYILCASYTTLLKLLIAKMVHAYLMELWERPDGKNTCRNCTTPTSWQTYLQNKISYSRTRGIKSGNRDRS